MSRYYHVLSDDGRRCHRCKRRSQIFGNNDVESTWIGCCSVCNMDNYETGPQYFYIGTDDTADETYGLELDWSLFTDAVTCCLWLWRASTGECFYIDRPPAHWPRYCCKDYYWWHNVESSAWFYERSVRMTGTQAVSQAIEI